MKQTLIAVAAAVVFVGALWLGLPLLQSHFPKVGTASVEPGFVGRTQFGAWFLRCEQPKSASNSAPAFSLTPGHGSPLPPPPDAPKSASAGDENSLGRCAALFPVFADKDRKHVVMVVSFRTLGNTDKLAMIVRFPVIAKKGDDLVVKAGQTGFKLPVNQCSANMCIAAGGLGPAGENLLTSNKMAILVFPAGSDGKRRAARVPLADISMVLASLRRAQS